MFGDVIVPLDGSEEAAQALGPASAIARYLNVTLQIVAYHPPTTDGTALRAEIADQVEPFAGVKRSCLVEPARDSVAEQLIEFLDARPASLAVMATHGRGRSAAVLGSVANGVLHDGRTPVLLIGPNVTPGRFRLHGKMIVAMAAAGTQVSDAIVPVVEAFIAAFDFEPEVVSVLDPSAAAAYADRTGGRGGDLPPESSDVARVAAEIGRTTGTDVDFETLHDTKVAKAIAAHAEERNAALIAMATRAETGGPRLMHGSVAADVVAKAPCPVLAFRG